MMVILQKKFHRLVDTVARDAQIARINELQDFIKQQPAHLEAFDEALVKRWLERIIVWEDHFTVELKSGKGQILRPTPNTAPLICGACYNTQPEDLLTMA